MKTLLIILACLPVGADSWPAEPVVETEEVVTQYTPANNGAGPMWCHGSTVIVRNKGEVYASTIETGKDIPPLCNTRWQLWRKKENGPWKLIQHEESFRQREPCPISIFQTGEVFLSVNPSTQPAGTMYGACRPLVLEFDSNDPARPFRSHEPVWPDAASFTDHSYRGFAADGQHRELLLLNINNETGEQCVSYRDRLGQWHQKGKIAFPIRACYPQVALKDKAAHVLAIGDIVEPDEKWRALKREHLKSGSDYVFRRLFYTYTPNIDNTPFCEPIEVDSVEQTAGKIRNRDLHIDASGLAHILYLKMPHQYAFIRDRYFPGELMTASLEYVQIRDGRIIRQETLETTAQGNETSRLSSGRFHIDGDENIWVIMAGTMNAASGNYLLRIRDHVKGSARKIPLEHPFDSFFTATPRAGTHNSDIIDMFGVSDDPLTLRYARIRLKVQEE